MKEFFLRVEEVVAVTMLGSGFPLEKMLSESERSTYEPERFPGLVVRQAGMPGVAALIFSSGKVVCTGAKSPESAKEAMKKVLCKMADKGISIPREPDIGIDNIVASTKLKSELDLKEISEKLEGAEYDASPTPMLVYKMKEPKFTFILFPSGKILCTGAKSLDDVQKGLLRLKESLEKAGVKVVPAKE